MKQTASKTLLDVCFMLVYSTLKMEGTHFSKMSVDFQWTTQHYISEERTLYNLGVGMARNTTCEEKNMVVQGAH
jgi:hypothetical protein